MNAADVVLVPGLWLDASSWDRVTPSLERAGHRVHALTLPGLESIDQDRAGITLADQVTSVVDAIDAAPGPVLVVGHSAGSAVAALAVDARPDRVERAVYIGGWPAREGGRVAEGFETRGADLPLPALTEFDDADLRDLDEAGRADLVSRAIPSPAALATDAVHYTDERRLAVPVTLVCPEYTAADLRGWLAEGAEPLAELALLRDVEFVDLATGHWPQLTRPEELAHLLLGLVHPADNRA